MKYPTLVLLFLMATTGKAGSCVIDVKAPGFAGERILLRIASDLVTDRMIIVADGIIAPDGSAHLETDVEGTVKARLTLRNGYAGLFLRPGAHYTIHLPAVTGSTTTIAGTTEITPQFEGLDIFDVNALVSDLNTRVDAFLAEGQATDQDAGMDAVQHLRTQPKDSLHQADRPPTLFVLLAPGKQRVDTFEMKLRKFYADAKDPWFWHYLDFSIAGLRLGPRTDDRWLFERFIQAHPIAYDDPEQLRFLQNFFGEKLMTDVLRTQHERLKTQVAAGSIDSVLAIFSEHPFLSGDPQLTELVMLMELYADYHGKRFDRVGIRSILALVNSGSTVEAHRTIAANMLWDLTWMSVGSSFPDLVLREVSGSDVQLHDRLEGPACIAITAAWCGYCEQQLEAMEELRADYGDLVRFIVISVDSSWQDFTRHSRVDKSRDWIWLYAGDDPRIMDQLRLRAVPAFFLLNDRSIAYNPAPLPSEGMAAILHRMKVEAEEQGRIKFGNEPPPPKRER